LSDELFSDLENFLQDPRGFMTTSQNRLMLAGAYFCVDSLQDEICNLIESGMGTAEAVFVACYRTRATLRNTLASLRDDDE